MNTKSLLFAMLLFALSAGPSALCEDNAAAKSKEDAQRLIEDAKALEEAGVFAIVLESIPPEVARTVTAQLSIPTIGIGAGPHCDGQVLVSYDVLGLTEYSAPSFAKRYAQLGEAISEAARTYAQEVRDGQFP